MAVAGAVVALWQHRQTLAVAEALTSICRSHRRCPCMASGGILTEAMNVLVEAHGEI